MVFDQESKISIIENSDGIIIFEVQGKEELLQKLFGHESGGHRIQRIPPTEKRGRVHTSTITIATFKGTELNQRNDIPKEFQFDEYSKDIEIKTCRGSGAGGQHRNKTDTAVQVTYLPTGLSVRSENGRSQYQNKMTAMELLRTRLISEHKKLNNNTIIESRKNQVGSGMRGDKRRTIRFQDGIVTDHVLNIQWNLKNYLKGDFSYER